MKKVVIIGSGFAGLTALNQLLKSKEVKVTLIAPNPIFLFTPRLTELLNQSIPESRVFRPLPRHERCTLIQEKASEVDVTHKVVRTPSRSISYDYLLCAQGARTNYFGNESIEKYALEYKGYDSVNKIRNHIAKMLEQYKQDPHQRYLRFVIIGAGLSGVELMFSLREYVMEQVKGLKLKENHEPSFILIQRDAHITPVITEKLRTRIEKALRAAKVIVKINTAVESIDGEIIRCDKEDIRAGTVIWTAGIIANTLSYFPEIKIERGGKVEVTPHLNLTQHPEIFLAGDASLLMNKDRPFPATAQVAWQQGICAGKNILRSMQNKELEPFRYLHKGTLIILGKKRGIFEQHGFVLEGLLAWHLRDQAYRMRMRQLRLPLEKKSQ